MDSAELAHIFDAISGGTCADRFLSILAANSPTHPNLTSPDLPISSPPFDMPLVAAQASFPLDSLPPAPSHLPPTVMPHSTLDTPYLLPEYSMPASVVTTSYRSNTNSIPCDNPIQKKKRSRHDNRLKREPVSVLAVTASRPNLSFASDISAITPTDESPLPHSNLHLAPKPEPSLSVHTSTPSSTTHQRPISSPPTAIPSSTPTPPKSHTRKCREKVTRQFENLLDVLPSPPRGIEVKHKAQILDYTINIFRHLLLRRTALQAEIALASKPALAHWINSVLYSAASTVTREPGVESLPLSAVLEQFLGLYCVKKNWTYGEMWLTNPDNHHASLASCVFNSEDNTVLKKLDAFATDSRNRFQHPAKLDAGIITRAIASRRPEWLEQPACDPPVFSRADIAKAQGICVIQTLPIVLALGRCPAVLLFADVKPHSFSTADVTVAKEYAEVIGDSYVEYLRGVQNRCAAAQRRVDGRVQSKWICSAEEKPGLSATQISNDPRLRGTNCGARGMTRGFISQTETSSRFFADSDLMGRRCS